MGFFPFTLEVSYQHDGFLYISEQTNTLFQGRNIITYETIPTTKITFEIPPATEAVITADYTVPYIVKDSDRVLDVGLEIQFGEGV